MFLHLRSPRLNHLQILIGKRMIIHSLDCFRNQADPSWLPYLTEGLANIDKNYLQALTHSQEWLPGPNAIFNAFSLPLEEVHYVLFGESPYPRRESANGYAFWDNAVHELWSSHGLSKSVNRATSLRNIIKMLLVADGALKPADTSQHAITQINKSHYVQTNASFFQNLINHGFLLLNATPVLQAGPPQKDAKAWHPFTASIVHCLLKNRPKAKFILLGKIANSILPLLENASPSVLTAEHPYNLSFIQNREVIGFFKPLHLLRAG